MVLGGVVGFGVALLSEPVCALRGRKGKEWNLVSQACGQKK